MCYANTILRIKLLAAFCFCVNVGNVLYMFMRYEDLLPTEPTHPLKLLEEIAPAVKNLDRYMTPMEGTLVVGGLAAISIVFDACLYVGVENGLARPTEHPTTERPSTRYGQYNPGREPERVVMEPKPEETEADNLTASMTAGAAEGRKRPRDVVVDEEQGRLPGLARPTEHPTTEQPSTRYGQYNPGREPERVVMEPNPEEIEADNLTASMTAGAEERRKRPRDLVVDEEPGRLPDAKLTVLLLYVVFRLVFKVVALAGIKEYVSWMREGIRKKELAEKLGKMALPVTVKSPPAACPPAPAFKHGPPEQIAPWPEGFSPGLGFQRLK
ncbi:uncharacterized protein LOC135395332 isoform X3 [Ornithodoros turicata]|uniref:uncharacterized protein LOC135395332 isoform X3 n=1 Tax=Ornithodoros turicata TaxID=34597 RepID=UPI0031396502